MATDAQTGVRALVENYYGRVLQHGGDLKTNACCVAGPPPSWLAPLLANVHDDVLDRFYGCGFPFPEALPGCTVLDLGCGTGRDVFVLSQMVGSAGRVIGVDMTESQLAVARETSGWHMDRFGYKDANVAFHQGYIEDLSDLDVAPGSIDVAVSNCVFNLSPRKDRVLAEAQRVLKPGGELYFSDVFADRRLPRAIVEDPVLYAECLGGAMYQADFLSLARRSGFLDPRVVSFSLIEINDAEARERVGAARFFSVTLRLFKLDGLDEQCEDYGQIATFKGGLPEAPVCFRLDDHHLFEAGRPERVCGNTAAMLAQTRFAEHFDVVGDKRVHYGVFDCSATMAAQQYQSVATSSAASSCC